MIALQLLAALLIVLALANLIFGRLPKAPESGGGIIDTEHGPLHYVEHVGEGLPIVFLHGMPSTAREFDRVRAQLGGRHTLAFDRPGYAWSTGDPQSFAHQLDAVVEASRTLGVDRAIVVGHSFGGLAALGLAVRHAEFVVGLLLIAPAAGGARVTESMERQARMIMQLERPAVRQLADLLFFRLARKHAARIGAREVYGDAPELSVQRHIAESMLARHNSVRALCGDRLGFNDNERMITKQLRRVTQPTVILQGEDDRTTTLKNAHRLHDALAASDLVEVPGDHYLPTKWPEVVVEALATLEDR
jgi:pimeloyl-ACP methyl ester carboxylesterase